MAIKQGFRSICARDVPFKTKGNPPHNLPVFATSTFIYESPEKAMRIFRREEEDYIYSRWSNPTIRAVEQKLAQMECFDTDIQAEALLFGSGMAAITALVMASLKPGDKLLTHGNIYGTTTELFQSLLEAHNIKPVIADLSNPGEISNILSADRSIRLIFIESPTNPTLECTDFGKVAGIAHEHNVLTAVDNTFATAYLQRPFRWGVDFVVYSTTKFLNGHGTALGGALIGQDIPFIKGEAWRMRKILGSNTNAFESWLLNNGMKTLPLRMDRHSQNATKVATFLNDHPAVESVNYPGLTGHRSHEIAKKQMSDFGGVLSFVLKDGLDAGFQLMKNIKFCTLTATLGTTDTLIQHPASMTHVNVPKPQREKSGISDGLIRMSVGLEDEEDIIEDLNQALATAT